MELILILIGIAIAIAAISKIFSAFERARKYDKIKPQLRKNGIGDVHWIIGLWFIFLCDKG